MIYVMISQVLKMKTTFDMYFFFILIDLVDLSVDFVSIFVWFSNCVYILVMR